MIFYQGWSTHETTRLQARESFADKVVVPESLKAFVIGCHHNLPMYGHQGRKRTEQMICARYYWKGMSKDIRKIDLQAVLFSYRVSINDATGYSPYYLISGRMPTAPIDLAFPLRHEAQRGIRASCKTTVCCSCRQ